MVSKTYKNKTVTRYLVCGGLGTESVYTTTLKEAAKEATRVTNKWGSARVFRRSKDDKIVWESVHVDGVNRYRWRASWGAENTAQGFANSVDEAFERAHEAYSGKGLFGVVDTRLGVVLANAGY